jgi:hypothetical protein
MNAPQRPVSGTASTIGFIVLTAVLTCVTVMLLSFVGYAALEIDDSPQAYVSYESYADSMEFTWVDAGGGMMAGGYRGGSTNADSIAILVNGEEYDRLVTPEESTTVWNLNRDDTVTVIVELGESKAVLGRYTV